jgi:hypothetical protein
MILAEVDSSGVERWSCGQCARVVLIERDPEFRRTVVQAGDETALHSSGKGGLNFGTSPLESGAGNISETEQNWLAEIGICWDDPESA